MGRWVAAGVVCDDRGEVLAADAPCLARKLGRNAGGAAVIDHAVRTLGFVRIVRLPRGLLVRFAPAIVHPLAAISAFYRIAGERPERLVLLYYVDCERFEIFADVAAGLKRIEALLEANGNPVSRSLFRAEILPASRLHDIAGGRFAPLVAAWRETGGQWDMAHYGFLQTLGLLSCALIVRNPAGSQRMLKEFRGSFDDHKEARQWRVGHDLEEQPDRHYGEWVAATYRRCLSSREPRLDAVDVVLAPSGRRKCVRFRYDRILLPWQAKNGDRMAVSALFMHHPPPP